MKLQKFWVLIIALFMLFMVCMYALINSDVLEETPEFVPENAVTNSVTNTVMQKEEAYT